MAACDLREVRRSLTFEPVVSKMKEWGGGVRRNVRAVPVVSQQLGDIAVVKVSSVWVLLI